MKFKIIFPAGHQVADIQNDNLDICVVLPTGEVYCGTLFTLTNIKFLMEQEQGCSFWAADMVIVKDLRKDTIYQATYELIDAAHLASALTCIGNISTIYPDCQSFEGIPKCTMRVIR